MTPEIYWIDVPPPGRLAVMPHPRGGEWLSEELAELRRGGVDVLVSLLIPSEVAELGLKSEARLCEHVGISFVSFPIPDRSVPEPAEAAGPIERICQELDRGSGCAIHCRFGIGRSATIAAAVLLARGVTEPFDLISQARGLSVPDTGEQALWIDDYRDWLGRHGRD